jgi:DNA-binding Lrp family transcriptional regulator
VKKMYTVKISGLLGASALRILKQTQGLEVITRHGRVNRRAEATVSYAGNRVRVAVEVKRRANAATAWQLVHEAGKRPDTPLLLIADETTVEARRILQEHGIAFVDGLGNALIQLPGLLFHLGSRQLPRRPALRTPPTRLSGKAGVAAQALLLHPRRVWHVQDLAREAGVSPGLAHRVLTRLEKEGVITAEGVGPNRTRRLTAPTALLDLWVEESVAPPTLTLLHVLAQTPQQLLGELGANLGRSGIEYALTGAAGATLIAPFVTAIPVVDVWVAEKAASGDLCEAAKGERVTDGQNVVFMQTKDDTPLAFREEVKGLWLVNRFRLYADLRRDPRRGREQAEHLRREVIGF